MIHKGRFENEINKYDYENLKNGTLAAFREEEKHNDSNQSVDILLENAFKRAVKGYNNANKFYNSDEYGLYRKEIISDLRIQLRKEKQEMRSSEISEVLTLDEENEKNYAEIMEDYNKRDTVENELFHMERHSDYF